MSCPLNTPQERLIFADVLRITSAFFVIMIHVSAPFIYRIMDGSDMSAGSTVFLNVFSRFAVPVYFMLSGMFLLSEKSDCSVETVFRKRLPRILLPLAAWSFFYAAFSLSRRIIHTGGVNLSTATEFIRNTAAGHYHLWFLYVLAGLYLLLPILKPALKDRRTAYYICIFCAGISFFRDTVVEIVQTYAVSAFAEAETVPFAIQILIKCGLFFIGIVENLLNQCELDFFTMPVFLFVLGHLLLNIRLTKRQRILLYTGGVLCLIFMFAVSLFNIRHGIKYDFFLNSGMLPACIFGASVFVFVKEQFNGKTFSEKISRLIADLGRYSFGIYLVHDFFITVCFKLVPHGGYLRYPLLSLTGYTLAVFLLSWGTCLLFTKIPGLKRFFT